MPQLAGHCFYADYCEGWIRSFEYANGSETDPIEWELPDVGSDHVLRTGRPG